MSTFSATAHTRWCVATGMQRPGPAAFPAVRGVSGPLDEHSLDVDVLGMDDQLLFMALDIEWLLRRSCVSFVRTTPMWLPGYGEADTWNFWRVHERTPMEELSWDGMHLAEVIRGSAAAELVCAQPRGEMLRPLRWLMEEAIQCYEATKRSLTLRRGPRALVAWNGLYHRTRAAAEAARKVGAGVIVQESSFLAGLDFLEESTTATGNHSSVGRLSLDRLRFQAFGEAEQADAALVLAQHARQVNAPTGKVTADERERVLQTLGLPPSTKVLLLLGQVCFDTAITYGATHTADIVELAQIAAAEVARVAGWTLVVRPHPLEHGSLPGMPARIEHGPSYVRLMQAGLNDLPHVRVQDPRSVSPYAMMRVSQAGLTITSQSALEMAAMYGKPVVVAGDAFFAGKGFTRDAGTKEGLAASIAAVLQEPVLKAEAYAKALQFVRYVAREALFPHDLAREPRREADAVAMIRRAVALGEARIGPRG